MFSGTTLNVVHRPVHKSKAKESYALHNHSTLLQGSQSLEKSLSFSSSLNFIFPSKLLEFLWKSLNCSGVESKFLLLDFGILFLF